MRQLIISVHGIRTFGDWQERLEQLVNQEKPKDRDITIRNYKFGWFSVAAFLIPFLRWLVVRQFRRFLVEGTRIKDPQAQNWDRVDLVGHSFGTHIIAWALYGIKAEQRPPVHTIIFAASVLTSNFPWQALLSHPVKRVINDCGVNDAVLILSQFGVLFTGMAGRLGFNGGTGDNFRNRFHSFGHSGYFLDKGLPDNAFMRESWVPLLVSDAEPKLVDRRKSTALSGIGLTLLNNAEPIKFVIYMTLAAAPVLWINGLYMKADSQRARAEEQARRANASFETSRKLLSHFVRVVSENVQPIAQLTTVESLLRSAQEAIDKLPVTPQEDTSIALERARILNLLADVRWEHGDISGMWDLAQHARTIIKQIAPTAKDNPEGLHVLAESSSLIGRYYATQPDKDQALTEYMSALTDLKELEGRFDKTERTADDWRWLRLLGFVQRDLGDLMLTKFAKVRDADDYYQDSIKSFNKLRRYRPTDPDVAFQLAWSTNKLGDVFVQYGKYGAALGEFQKAASEIEALGDRLWENLRWRFLLAIVYNNIGVVRSHQKGYADAIEYFEKAEKELNKLLERDAKHSNWDSIRAWTYDNIGETRVRWARDEYDVKYLEGARDKLRSAENIRAALFNSANNNLRWSDDLSITQTNIIVYNAVTMELANHFADAAQQLDIALTKLPLSISDERRESIILRQIELLKWAGLDFRQAGKNDEGNQRLQKALDVANKTVVNQPVNHEAFAAAISDLNTLVYPKPP